MYHLPLIQFSATLAGYVSPVPLPAPASIAANRLIAVTLQFVILIFTGVVRLQQVDRARPALVAIGFELADQE